MWSSPKTHSEAARTTPEKTSRSCDASPSTCCGQIPGRHPFAARSNEQDGSMNTSSTCSAKCDSPAGLPGASGGGRVNDALAELSQKPDQRRAFGRRERIKCVARDGQRLPDRALDQPSSPL